MSSVHDGPALVLGVDAGNSKTVAVVADVAGAVLGYGRAGCGDIYGAGEESLAEAEVMTAVDQALRMATGSTDHTALTHAAFCLAGIDWESDELFWCEHLARRLPGLGYSLHNDGFALLRAGHPEGDGVAISAGTGGAVVARGPRGEWSASFWIVDPVGGFCLGSRAYAAVVRAELGIGPPTALRTALLRLHGYADVHALLEGSTSRGSAPLRHAALARDVLDCARAGDEVARGIVHDQAEAFAAYAWSAADRVGLTGPGITVVLGGSVLSSENPLLRDATSTALGRWVPDSTVALSPRSPVVGAVAEAISELTGPLGPGVIDRLTAARFPPEFLLT